MLEEESELSAVRSDAGYASPRVARLREDLALALRAAAHHGLSEGVCNHFSVLLPGAQDRYLINPRGLHWSEVGPEDIVLIDLRARCWRAAIGSSPPPSLSTARCTA